jgi:hypothetical protein
MNQPVLEQGLLVEPYALFYENPTATQHNRLQKWHNSPLFRRHRLQMQNLQTTGK